MLKNLFRQLRKQFLPLSQHISLRTNATQKVAKEVAATKVDVNNNNKVNLNDETNDLNAKDVAVIVQVTPILQTIPIEVWQRMHNTFLIHGLNTQNFLRIIAGNPKLLLRPTNKVSNTLEYWRSCQFGEYFLFTLLTKYPELMDLNDHQKLINRINFLQSYVSTSKNVWRLLMNSPLMILKQSEANLEEKFRYLQDVMRLEIPEIVKSQALTLSLNDIKCRHVFLERLGMFKPRSIRADPDEPTKNPRLYKITDTSEKTFATKVCHVPLEEYECFKVLFQRELKRKEAHDNHDENNSDYDDDDDDDNVESINDEVK